MALMDGLSRAADKFASRFDRQAAQTAMQQRMDAAARRAELGRKMFPVKPAMPADQLALSSQATSSVVHFDAATAEQTLEGAGRLQSKIQGLGWRQPGSQVTLDNGGTYLHYRAAGQTEWKDAPLQYLQDNQQGFLLRDVAPGSQIEASPHVIVDQSHNGFYSIDQKTPDDSSAWLTGYGESFHWKTQPNTNGMDGIIAPNSAR